MYNYIFYMFVSKCKEIRADSDVPYWQLFIPVLKCTIFLNIPFTISKLIVCSLFIIKMRKILSNESQSLSGQKVI